jgi:predicted Holliday junction resolvase-like endonuclease
MSRRRFCRSTGFHPVGPPGVSPGDSIARAGKMPAHPTAKMAVLRGTDFLACPGDLSPSGCLVGRPLIGAALPQTLLSRDEQCWHHSREDYPRRMNPDIVALVIVGLSILVIILLIALSGSGRRTTEKARVRFEEWRAKELETAKQELVRLLTAEYELKMLQWRGAYEANIRADAILRSSAVIRGKVSEHLAPFIHFPYNPRDARFIGSPIDIIVFNGAEDGNITEVVFLEVKSGPSAGLTPRQRQIRALIEAKKVEWREMRI